MDVRDEDLCFGYSRRRVADVVQVVPIYEDDVVVATGGGGAIPHDANDSIDPMHSAKLEPLTSANTELEADSEDIEDVIRMVEAMEKEQREAEAAGVIVRVDNEVDAKYDAGSGVDLSCSPAELAELQLAFAKLKSFITGLVSVKKLRNWDNIKTVLASGQLSESTFTSALVKVGGNKPHAQLNFNQFLHLMILLEDELSLDEEGIDTEEQEEEQDEEQEKVGEEKSKVGGSFHGVLKVEDTKATTGEVDLTCSQEELAYLQRSFAELKSSDSLLVSVSSICEWDTIQSTLRSGQLSESTFIASLVKVKAGCEAADMSAAQLNFNQFLHLMILLEDELASAEEAMEEGEAGKKATTSTFKITSTSKEMVPVAKGEDEVRGANKVDD